MDTRQRDERAAAVAEKDAEAARKRLRRDLRLVLSREEAIWTAEERVLVAANPEATAVARTAVLHSRDRKRKFEEHVDPPSELATKIDALVGLLRTARHAVVYSGAGISTACGLPDYRGPRGLWTLQDSGKEAAAAAVVAETENLIQVRPSYTHMALCRLAQHNVVKHILSQNCDGLHLRSGLPRSKLSEIHGNSFIEYCDQCQPQREYVRSFDVTVQSRLRRHETGRACDVCEAPLKDTIVHFGEKGYVNRTHNWRAALDHSRKADLILCLGTSLKILKAYPLWGADRLKAQQPQLVVVNLQWTPKDKNAVLKIHAPVDAVMAQVMAALGLSVCGYTQQADGILQGHTPTGTDAPSGRGLGWLGRGSKHRKIR